MLSYQYLWETPIFICARVKIIFLFFEMLIWTNHAIFVSCIQRESTNPHLDFTDRNFFVNMKKINWNINHWYIEKRTLPAILHHLVFSFSWYVIFLAKPFIPSKITNSVKSERHATHTHPRSSMETSGHGWIWNYFFCFG